MYALIISALLYLGAFVYPDYLCVGVFTWIIPLLRYDYGFMAGYAWGLVFFGGHLAWFACIVYTKGQGDYRMLAYFAAVAYFSLFSGFWLWFKQLLVYRYVNKIKNLNRKCVALCCTWVISTATFIYLTCYCSLAIFDCFDGYPFINPLLPLVSWQWFLRPIFVFHPICGWIIIVVVNVSIASFYNKYDIKSLMFIIVLLCLPLLFQPKLQKIIVQKKDFFYVQPVWNNQHVTQAQIFYAIGRHLDTVAQQHHHVKYIIMPESAFPYNLMDWKDKLAVWTSLFDDVTIFIGAHRASQPLYKASAYTTADTHGKIFNSLYQISDEKIVAWYDKSHLVPFVERMPQYLSVCSGLFTADDQIFSYPVHDQSHVQMDGFQPYICSELFCQAKKPASRKPILFICNDSWLVFDYARDLAKRSATLYSLRYQVPILYVGSYDYTWLSESYS